MRAFRNILRQGTPWMETKPRTLQASSPSGPTPEEALNQLLHHGDRAALLADGPSLPFLDTSPLTYHVEGDPNSSS